MPRRILLTALATLAAFATGAAQTDAATPEQIADVAWPNSPCHGQPVTERFQTDLIATDTGDHLAGYASGLLNGWDGLPVVPFVAARCEITTDPVEYARMTPEQKCVYKVHEYGHLAGLQHTATGPMSIGDDRYYAPCATLRGRVRHDIEALVPFGAQVACGRWQGRAFTCVADWADDRGRAFNRRYRVRTRGGAYAIAASRSARSSRQPSGQGPGTPASSAAPRGSRS
jgi:hypothetical protein